MSHVRSKIRVFAQQLRNQIFGDRIFYFRKLGFLDDDAKIDFSNFKVGKSKEKEQEVEEEVTSIFGKLTSAFKNFTGNKVLTASDIEPIL